MIVIFCVFSGRPKNNCKVRCNSREMTACLSTTELCNADLTPVIFKSRNRSLCKRSTTEKWKWRASLTKWRGVFLNNCTQFRYYCTRLRIKRLKQCSSLVHEVWNNTFSFSWSLVIPYCPSGHTHFRYHIRPFLFHAGLTANAQAMREIPSLGHVLKSMACTKHPHPYLDRVNELQYVWSVNKKTRHVAQTSRKLANQR